MKDSDEIFNRIAATIWIIIISGFLFMVIRGCINPHRSSSHHRNYVEDKYERWGRAIDTR